MQKGQKTRHIFFRDLRCYLSRCENFIKSLLYYLQLFRRHRFDELRLERVRPWGLVVLEVIVSNLLHLRVLDGAFEAFLQEFGVMYLAVLEGFF